MAPFNVFIYICVCVGVYVCVCVCVISVVQLVGFFLPNIRFLGNPDGETGSVSHRK